MRRTTHIPAAERGDTFYREKIGADPRLEFGLQPPPKAVFAGGFRAILGENGRLTFLADRMSRSGPESADVERLRAYCDPTRTWRELTEWADLVLKDEVAEICRKSLNLLWKTSDVFVIGEGDFYLAVSGNSSHGYLYGCYWNE